MTVVKINALSATPGREADLEARFAERATQVDTMPGFLGFELLRPVSGEDRYFVYTRWESEEAFEGWVRSPEFRHGHAQSMREKDRPVAHASQLLSFEVAQSAGPARGNPTPVDE